jgi:hypothetical protein
MKISRCLSRTLHATLVGAFVVGLSSVAMAQRSGPPATTRGATKSNPKADDGQATAHAARTASLDRKAAKAAFKHARSESKSLLRGIGFTRMEQRMNRDITKRYDAEYKALEKAHKVALKAGTPDALILRRINALRLRERAELRAAMMPDQRVRFDINISTVDAN